MEIYLAEKGIVEKTENGKKKIEVVCPCCGKKEEFSKICKTSKMIEYGIEYYNAKINNDNECVLMCVCEFCRNYIDIIFEIKKVVKGEED